MSGNLCLKKTGAKFDKHPKGSCSTDLRSVCDDTTMKEQKVRHPHVRSKRAGGQWMKRLWP